MITSVASKNHVDRHLEEFMRMCAWIEICGSIGHYADFRVNCDGDGPLRLKFDFYGDKLDELDTYKKIKNELLEEYSKQNREPKVFMFD